MIERIKWYLKQLLPLTYVSEYTEDGVRWVEVWKMWFGRCYKIRRSPAPPVHYDCRCSIVERIEP